MQYDRIRSCPQTDEITGAVGNLLLASCMNAAASIASVDEIAEILAADLMRLRGRKSSQIAPNQEESSLHISPAKSGDPKPKGRRAADG